MPGFENNPVWIAAQQPQEPPAPYGWLYFGGAQDRQRTPRALPAVAEQARADILYKNDWTVAQRLRDGEFGAYSQGELYSWLGPEALQAEVDRINASRERDANKSGLDKFMSKVADFVPAIATGFLAWLGGTAIAGAGAGAGGAEAAGSGAAAGAGGESVIYLDALEEGLAAYDFAAVAPAAAAPWYESWVDTGQDLLKQWAGGRIVQSLAPDVASPPPGSMPVGPRVQFIPAGPQSGDALGSLLTPAGQRNLVIFGGLAFVAVVALKVLKK